MLDILVVAFILYELFLFFVDTRVMRLFKWLALFGGVVVFARFFQLETLSWLLSKLLAIAIFSIPVIFQPELRRLLEGVGRKRSLKREENMEQAELLADRVSRGLMDLRSKGIGGLFVLQGQTVLRHILRSGVPLNAAVSPELLVSLFWGGNPLHDGAVVLDQNGVVAAACYLPLTDDIEISKYYGTRHRAALGLTEQSDALCLIVSEETRQISLAVNGHLSKHLNDGQIKKLLLHYYQNKDEKTLTERLREEFRTFWEGEEEEEEHPDE